MKAPYRDPPISRHSSPATGKLFFLTLLLAIFVMGNSCGFMHNLFGPKTGCPSDGKNVGAERILSGEKVPRSPKFKA